MQPCLEKLHSRECLSDNLFTCIFLVFISWCFSCVFSVCACLDLSVSSSSWGLCGRGGGGGGCGF